MTAPKRNRVSGIDRSFQVLDYLMERGTPATAYDIAKAVGAPTSTIYEVIETLEAKTVLRRSHDGLVALGPKLHFYGLAYVRDLDISSVFQRAMEDLSRATEETVQICGRDDDKMVVLMMEEGPGYFRVTSRVGSRVPLNWTASGRLLAAALPDAERAELFARAQPSPTGRAETDPARLEQAARKAWAEGLSIQISESDYAVACIASPIRNGAGECVATISLVVPEGRAQEQAQGFAERVRSAARGIEEAMGWRPPAPVRSAAE